MSDFQVVSNEPRWKVLARYALIFLVAALVIAGISFGVAQNRTREIRNQVQTIQRRPACFNLPNGQPSPGCTDLAALLATTCRTQPRFCAGIVGEGVARADPETRARLTRLIRQELTRERVVARRRADARRDARREARRRADRRRPTTTGRRLPGGGSVPPSRRRPPTPTLPNAPSPPAPIPNPGAGGVPPGPGNNNPPRPDNSGRPGGTVSVPPATTPPVNTPPAGAPPVTIPPVNVPPVTTPTVRVCTPIVTVNCQP